MTRILIKLTYLFVLSLTAKNLSGQIVNIEEKRNTGNDTASWFGQLGLSLSYTKTTSELLQGSGDIQLHYIPGKNRLSFFSQFNQVSADEKDYLNNAFLHLRHNYPVNEWLTTEFFTQYQYDKQKKIQGRFLTGTGLRFKIFENKKLYLYIASLIMVENETLTDKTVNNVWRSSSYISFQWHISDDVSFRNITYYQPRPDRWNDYRIALENWFDFDITQNFSIRISSDLNYDSEPPAGVPSIFYTGKTGIVFTF